MNRYAHIENGKVTNISLWDGESGWDPGCETVLIPNEVQADIGYLYDGSTFSKSPEILEREAQPVIVLSR